LKRKMKMASKQGKDISRIADISSSSAQKKRKIEEDGSVNVDADPNTTVVAFKPKPEISSLGVFSSGDEWPFEGLCEQLSFDLFSLKWETRHGAAIGLRQLLKVHGSGYGKVVGLDKMKNQQRHEQLLEDLAIRLLCVLALDQFTDFVGDQAVVPVRETCAQTLGVVMQLSPPSLCTRVVNEGLLKLISFHSRQGGKNDPSQKWAVRLAALIGLKYWMAVRKDLLNQIIVPSPTGTDSPAFLAIVNGLKDHNDDVRAVATSSLIPITDILVELLPPRKVFDSIVVCLWDSLQELDDLTAATSFVMDLLSDLLRKPVIAQILREEATQFLEKLVPQLYPFFRHAITSVRLAVLRSLITLTTLSRDASTPATWIQIDLLRLLFQNFILEEKYEVLELSLQLWSQLCVLMSNESFNEDTLQEVIKTTLPVLFALLMSSIGTPIDPRLFISYASGSNGKRGGVGGHGLNIPPQDKAMLNQDLIVVSYDNIMKGRLTAAKAVGNLVSTLLLHPYTQELQPKIFEWINAYTLSGHAFHRIFIGVVMETCVDATKQSFEVDFLEAIPHAKTLWQQFVQILSDASAGGSLLFVELQNQLVPLHQDCTMIQNSLAQMGHPTPALPTKDAQGGDFFTVDAAEYFLDSVCPPLMGKASEILAELYRKAVNMKLSTRQLQIQLDTRVYSSLASAVVAFGMLPPKLNPVIRNLMSSAQTEENVDLQQRCAHGIAKMLLLNVRSGGKSNTNDKIVKNCCVYLCSDPHLVGLLVENPSTGGIITMDELKAIRIAPKRAPSKKKGVEIDADAAEAVKDAAAAAANEHERVTKRILHRGAESVVQSLCALFDVELFNSVGALWESMSSVLLEKSAKLEFDPMNAINPNDPSSQGLLDSLHVIEIVSKYLSPELHPHLMTLFPAIRVCLTTPYNLIRQLASKCIASIAKYVKVPAMIRVIEEVVPLTNHSTIDSDRQGAVECLYHIIEALQDEVLPYLIFLMAPLLSRMSDPNENVRFIATNAFAQLVKLAPLEAGVPNPVGFTQDLIERKNHERKFIGQLIGTEKVQEYELPVAIAAELRSYQKEGVSWLAFLNRYGLHGILCDGLFLLT
jgi:TATA-binding protein-associated factor